MTEKQRVIYLAIKEKYGEGVDRWFSTPNKNFKGKPPLYYFLEEIYDPFYPMLGKEYFVP